MKSALLLYSGFLTAILVVAIICSMISKSAQNDTIEQNLEDSIEYAVKMVQDDRALKYNGGDLEDRNLIGAVTWDTAFGETEDARLKEDFIGYLTANLNPSITKLDVDIYGADSKDGLLSAKVTATFAYPTGTIGKVSAYKTVILDKYVK